MRGEKEVMKETIIGEDLGEERGEGRARESESLSLGRLDGVRDKDCVLPQCVVPSPSVCTGKPLPLLFLVVVRRLVFFLKSLR